MRSRGRSFALIASTTRRTTSTFSFSDTSQSYPSRYGPGAMSQEYVDAVRRSLDAWNRDDFETYSAMAHPEIAWTSEVAERMAGEGTVYRGVEGLRRHWDEWRE